MPLPASIDPLTRPWQSKLLNLVKGTPKEREIIWIFDEVGNTGKSSFSNYLEDELRNEDGGYDWYCMSNIGKAADSYHLMIEACKEGWRGVGVAIDVSRSFENHIGIYATIEAMKNGRITSGKYQGGRARFASPHVIIFSNWWPDTSRLSQDRWSIWEIDAVTMDMTARDTHYKVHQSSQITCAVCSGRT